MLSTLVTRQLAAKFSYTWKRLVACNACGIKLQNGDSSTDGYYTSPNKNRVSKKQTLQDIKYLLFSQDLQQAKNAVIAGSPEDVEDTYSEGLICKRCSDAIHRNKYTLDGFQRLSYRDIAAFIPARSNVVHVVPLPEFPMHMSRDILEDSRFHTSLLLTKGDQLIRDKATLQKKVNVFFKDFLKYQLGLSTNKTIATSAIKKWNIKGAFSTLWGKNYLLGNPNVGKSTLINALIKEYVGHKIERTSAGEIIVPELPEEDTILLRNFLKSQFAGVSHIPNMTRNLQEYKVGDKIINDLPGFTENMSEIQYEKIIQKDWLDRIRKTDLFKCRKLKKKTYYSIVGSENGACYTLGGVFFIKPPAGTVNQIVNYIPGEEYEFKNIERGLEVFKSCSDSLTHPLEKYCGVKPEICDINQYSRHVIPPFQGSIEIIFKDIGYVLLRTTGRYKFTSLHEIWAPKGIEVCIREPLESLINQGYKEHVESRELVSSCPRKRPIISSTYIMNKEEQNTLEKMREMYLERTKNDLSSRRFVHETPLQIVKDVYEEAPNLYWQYQW